MSFYRETILYCEEGVWGAERDIYVREHEDFVAILKFMRGFVNAGGFCCALYGNDPDQSNGFNSKSEYFFDPLHKKTSIWINHPYPYKVGSEFEESLYEIEFVNSKNNHYIYGFTCRGTNTLESEWLLLKNGSEFKNVITRNAEGLSSDFAKFNDKSISSICGLTGREVSTLWTINWESVESNYDIKGAKKISSCLGEVLSWFNKELVFSSEIQFDISKLHALYNTHPEYFERLPKELNHCGFGAISEVSIPNNNSINIVLDIQNPGNEVEKRTYDYLEEERYKVWSPLPKSLYTTMQKLLLVHHCLDYCPKEEGIVPTLILDDNEDGATLEECIRIFGDNTLKNSQVLIFSNIGSIDYEILEQYKVRYCQFH